MLALAVVPSALAAPHNPKGQFEPFAYCPLEVKGVTECIYSASTGGSITIGKKTVPIKNPVIFQGGSGEEGEGVKFFGAEGAETLLERPQSVPGGLLVVTPPSWWPDSFQEWFDEQIDGGATDVTATLELAAPPTSIELSTQNLINQEGTALGLPVKIKLDNPLLGSSCYIGSDAKPVQIDFTTGTSGTVKGSPGIVNFNKALTRVIINDGRLANGTFAAPSVEGCGGLYSSYIDPLVNSALGLPSGSGENTAILEGKLQSANAIAVRKSE